MGTEKLDFLLKQKSTEDVLSFSLSIIENIESLLESAQVLVGSSNFSGVKFFSISAFEEISKFYLFLYLSIIKKNEVTNDLIYNIIEKIFENNNDIDLFKLNLFLNEILNNHFRINSPLFNTNSKMKNNKVEEYVVTINDMMILVYEKFIEIYSLEGDLTKFKNKINLTHDFVKEKKESTAFVLKVIEGKLEISAPSNSNKSDALLLLGIIETLFEEILPLKECIKSYLDKKDDFYSNLFDDIVSYQ